MNPSNRRALARVISHGLVGLAATIATKQLLGRRAGLTVSIVSFVGVTILHEKLDAPVADVVASVL